MRIRVYLADDHPLFRKGLRRVIDDDDELEFVGSSGDGAKALKDLLELEPDVAIIDISMPKMNGVEILSELRGRGYDRDTMRIVLLTGSECPDIVYSAMAHGACGYILKNSEWDNVAQIIKRVYNGETVIAPEVVTTLSRQIEGHARHEEAPHLTPRETEIIRNIADGMPHQEIAARLHVELSTIKTHLRNAYEKLNVKSGAAAVAEAIRRGVIK